MITKAISQFSLVCLILTCLIISIQFFHIPAGFRLVCKNKIRPIFKQEKLMAIFLPKSMDVQPKYASLAYKSSIKVGEYNELMVT